MDQGGGRVWTCPCFSLPTSAQTFSPQEKHHEAKLVRNNKSALAGSVTMAIDVDPSPTPDSFRTHLIALISAYQLGPSSGVPVPRYDGPRDWQTETILGCLSEFARRMWMAEEVAGELQSLKARGCFEYIDIDGESETECGTLRGTPRREREDALKLKDVNRCAVNGNGVNGSADLDTPQQQQQKQSTGTATSTTATAAPQV
ncbi:hypothetical protein AMATHDRAFT_79081, partial [Amanita thiersii Skay4041]